MKKTPIIKTCIYVIILISAKASFGQWIYNTAQNTPVIREVGKQIDLRMSEDGKGGTFIAWKDYRAGLPDIYIQYINAAGYRMWDTTGVPLCTDPADQSTPAITTDMTGGAIVAFSDWRSGIERDVYAQRIDSLGVIQWTINGVGIATKPVREHNEKIISDGAGGAIVVWEQQSGGQWDIWAQRVSHTGVIMWPFGGVPVCAVNANRLNPKVQKDGKGGAYITWQDFRNFTDYNVYAQRLDPSGNRLWGTDGIAICSAPDAQVDPKIDPDSVSGGIYIAWIDKRNLTDYDVYAQKIDSTGTILWANDGVPVCASPGSQSAQDILSTTGTNGLIVTWKDNRSGNYDIYAQKLDPNGMPQWAANGVPVCASIKDQLNPNIVPDHAGGAIICWQDSSFVDWNIRSQRINGNGVMQWMTNGVDVSTAIDNQTSPKNVSDGTGGSIYAWQDRRNGGIQDIYCHHLFSDGSPNMGINENLSDKGISVSPNPFTDNFNLTINSVNDEKVTVTILDIVGQNVLLTISNNIIDLKGNHSIFITSNNTDLPKGVYFIKVSGKDWVKTIKVIKA